jgi:hypothetical protein
MNPYPSGGDLIRREIDSNAPNLGTLEPMRATRDPVAPVEVSLERLREIVASGAQLVEVLPAKEFHEEHLPDAVSLPLKEFIRERVAVLDATRAVVVYCWNDT